MSAGILPGGAHLNYVKSGLAYQAIGDALRTRLSAVPDPRSVIADVWLAELARLLPELVERCPGLPRPVDNAGARLRLFEAAFRLVPALGFDIS